MTDEPEAEETADAAFEGNVLESPATSTKDEQPNDDAGENNSPGELPRDGSNSPPPAAATNCGQEEQQLNTLRTSSRASRTSGSNLESSAALFDSANSLGSGIIRAPSSHRRGSLPGAPAVAPRATASPPSAKGRVPTRKPSITASEPTTPLAGTAPAKTKSSGMSSLPTRRPSVSGTQRAPPGEVTRMRSRRGSLEDTSLPGSRGSSQASSPRVTRQTTMARKPNPQARATKERDSKLPAVGKPGGPGAKFTPPHGSKRGTPGSGSSKAGSPLPKPSKPRGDSAPSPPPEPALPVVQKTPEELAEEARRRVLERRAAAEAMFAERELQAKRARMELAETQAQVREAAVEQAEQVAWSYLFEAARDGDVDMVRMLLGPPPKRGAQGTAVMFERAGKKTLPIEVSVHAVDWVKEELRGGANNARGQWFTDFVHVNTRGGRLCRTALHTACAKGHTEVVRVLCEEFGADMDVVDSTGRTPVWEAARHGHQEIVHFLVDAGAHADTADMEGNSATHMAVRGGFSRIAQVLVDAGADLLKVNKKGVMAKDMYGQHAHLQAYLEGLGRVQAQLMTPQDAICLHKDWERPADRHHPDADFRHKRGHVVFSKGFFLVCERHVDTGECYISRSEDGFRSAQRVAGPFPEIKCLAVAQSGMALAGLEDGRLLHSLDQFSTYSCANPGRAHGRGSPLNSDSAEKASFGAAIRSLEVVDSNKSFVVGDAPLVSAEELMRTKAWKLFLELDENNSGSIESAEFQQFARSLGYRLSETQTQAVIAMLDKDGNGHVDFEEFFAWHRTQQKQCSAEPLLLRSRNGGHSFERVEVPMEALEACGGQPLSLIDVAFGGEGKRLGVILGRYGDGKSLLLVTTDGGSSWKFVDPQVWYETEKVRIDREKDEADRERARLLQEERAEQRRRMSPGHTDSEGSRSAWDLSEPEVEEAMRKAALAQEAEEAKASEESAKREKETEKKKPASDRTRIGRSSRRTSLVPTSSSASQASNPNSKAPSRTGSTRNLNAPSRTSSVSSTGSKEPSNASNPSSRGPSRTGSLRNLAASRTTSQGSTGVGSAQPSRTSSSSTSVSNSARSSRVSSASNSQAPSAASSRPGSRPGSAFRAASQGALEAGGTGLEATGTSADGSLADGGEQLPDETSFAPLDAFEAASRKSKTARAPSGGGKQPLFLRKDSMAQFSKGAKKGEEGGAREGPGGSSASIMAQKEAQLKELLEAKKRGKHPPEPAKAKTEDAVAAAKKTQDGTPPPGEEADGDEVPKLEKQPTEGLLSAVAERIGALERVGSRLVIDHDESPEQFYDDDDDTTGAFDEANSTPSRGSGGSTESPPPLSPLVGSYSEEFKRLTAELSGANEPDQIPDIEALALLAEEDLAAQIEAWDPQVQELIRRYVKEVLKVVDGDGADGAESPDGSNPFAINPYRGSQSVDWDGQRDESHTADVDFLRVGTASPSAHESPPPEAVEDSSPVTDQASPMTEGTIESPSPDRDDTMSAGSLSPDRDLDSPGERGNASAPPALMSKGHRPGDAAVPVPVPTGDGGPAAENAELEGFLRGALSILETNQAGGLQTVNAASDKGRLQSVSSRRTSQASSPTPPASSGNRRPSLTAGGAADATGRRGRTSGSESLPRVHSSAPRPSDSGFTPRRQNSLRTLGTDSPATSSPASSTTTSRLPSSASLRSQSSSRNLTTPRSSGARQPLQRSDSNSSLTSSTRGTSRTSSLNPSRTGSSTAPQMQRMPSNRSLQRGGSGRELTRQSSSSRISTADKKKAAQKKDAKASPIAHKPNQRLRQLREFTVDRLLEEQQKKLQLELQEAEMAERVLGVQLKQAVFSKTVEKHEGGPLSQQAIDLQLRLDESRTRILKVVKKIEAVLDESTKALTAVREEQTKGVKELEAREEQLKEEQKKTSRRGEEAKQKHKELQQALEEAEYEKSYFTANVEHTEEAIEEELTTFKNLVAHRQTVDAWGSLGLEPRAGIVAAGLWIGRVAVTASGVLLIAGPGGVQRSTNRGHTWTRTLEIDPEHEATCLSVAGNAVFAVLDRSLHRSSDAGETWAELGRCPPLDVAVSDIMQFCDGEHGFVANEHSNLHYTCDGGKTWARRLCTKKPFRFVPRLLAACGEVPP